MYFCTLVLLYSCTLVLLYSFSVDHLDCLSNLDCLYCLEEVRGREKSGLSVFLDLNILRLS